MSIMLNGAKFAIATVIGPAVPLTAISNAVNAVTTPAIPEGSVAILQSGWSELDEAPVLALDAGELSGYDTSDLVRFPAGEGVGSYMLASGFINLPKIHDIQKSGGEQNYSTRQYVSDPSGKQVQAPTFKSARTRTYLLDYQPDKPHFDALIELDRTQELTILRETLRNGDVIYYAGRVGFDKDTTTALNEFLSNALSFAPTADSIRYPAL